MLLTNIRRLCSQKPVSIAKLERETGIGNGTISRWDISSPSVENVQKVAEYFGISIGELLAVNEESSTTQEQLPAAQ